MPLLLLPLFVLGCLSTSREAKTSFARLLPEPTGPHSVGTSVFYATRATDGEPAPTHVPPARELTVQLWYPSQASEEQARAPYIPEAPLLEAMKAEGYLNLSLEVLETWHTIETHAVLEAPLADHPRRLPLLLFSHGFGLSRSNYTSIAEDLASHGYVVATIDHPSSGLMVQSDGQVVSFEPHPAGPSGKVEEIRKDASFVLDILLQEKGPFGRFAHRLDPERAGMLGHSLGGAAALDACRADPRFQACADLDGDPFGPVEHEGVLRPYLVMLNVPAASHRPPPEIRAQRDSLWQGVVSRGATPAFIVKIEGTSHYSFSDLPFIVPDSLMRKTGAALTPRRGFLIIADVLRAFFSHYLAQEGENTFLDAVAKRYPEVSLGLSHNSTVEPRIRTVE